MDYNSLKNYATSLALLYAWTLFAAAAFALGEKFFHGLSAQRQPASSHANERPRTDPGPGEVT